MIIAVLTTSWRCVTPYMTKLNDKIQTGLDVVVYKMSNRYGLSVLTAVFMFFLFCEMWFGDQASRLNPLLMNGNFGCLRLHSARANRGFVDVVPPMCLPCFSFFGAYKFSGGLYRNARSSIFAVRSRNWFSFWSV
jgi:hypothetical protein